MTLDQTLAILLLAAVVGMFIWGRWRFDIVAFAALIVAVLIGLLPAEEAFEGFANSAVITIAAVLVISRGLEVSGAIDRIAKVVVPQVKSLALQISSLSGFAAVLSAFMNNVGALALLMPATIEASRKMGRSPSLLLMPLSFGSILGGLITLIGTPPNIVMANYREQALGEPFGMFDFTPVGVAVAVAGLVFLALFGWRLIPKERQAKSAPDELFDIGGYIAEALVPKGAAAIDKTLEEIEEIAEKNELSVAGIIRKGQKLYHLTPRSKILERDILVLESGPAELDKFAHALGLEIKGGSEKDKEIFTSDDVKLAELVVSPESRAIGRLVGDLRLRSRYGINLLGVSRAGEQVHRRLHKVQLRAGDVLLVQAETSQLPDSVQRLGMLPLAGRGFEIGKRGHALMATLLLAVAVFLAALGTLKLTVALAAAALGMVLLNIVPLRDLYESVDWPVIVLVAAMIPVGGTLQSTGTTELIAAGILGLSSGWPIYIMLTAIFVVTMTLSDVMNNVATTVVMAPIALSIAHSLGANPDAFLMAVAVSASCAFLTPIGHKNNALVMGPGGYQFGDYWRVGLPLEALITAVAIPMILTVWPLY